MSNPLKTLHVPSIARAVSNQLANTRKHKEYEEKKRMEHAFEPLKSPVVRVDSDNVTEEQLQRVALELQNAAEAILGSNVLLAERGYQFTHRSLAHLLPVEYKWTVAGARVINALLEKVTSTSTHMPSWASEIEQHLAELKRNEDEKKQRRVRYDNDNRDTFEMLCTEVNRLIDMNDRRIQSYKHLFNYLRNGLPRYFRGARGVRIIHAVMRAKIQASVSWVEEMGADLEEALRRDAEYKQTKIESYGRNSQRLTYSVTATGDNAADVMSDVMSKLDSDGDNYSALDYNELR